MKLETILFSFSLIIKRDVLWKKKTITLFCIQKNMYTVTKIPPKFYSVTHDCKKKREW